MMRGFSFGSIHSSAYSMYMKSINRQVLPAINDSYVLVPGRHGNHLYPGEMHDRIIVFECALVQTSLENLRLKLRDVAAWLYTTERQALIFDDEPDIAYLAKLEGAIDLEQGVATGQFELVFRCEPLAYGTEQQASFVNDTVTVANPGTFEALPTFTVTFTVAAAEWKVTLGSKYVRVVRGFQGGDLLEINCATGAVLVNGIRSMFFLDWQNSQLFSLPVGESTLSILPAGISDTSIQFTPRWL